jgi:hypothetical protein
MEDSGRILGENDIMVFEEYLGQRLPDDYRSFLLCHNGGTPIPSAFAIYGMPKNPVGIVHELYGIDRERDSSNLVWCNEVFRGRLPPNLLPIGCTPSDDQICVSLYGDEAGAVVLWDFYGEHHPPSFKNVYAIAPSFKEFENSLFLYEDGK